MNGPDIILPVYNDLKYLPASLRSVLGQSLPPRRLVVVDDASTEDVRSVVERFRRRFLRTEIIYLRNPENRGVIYSNNRGLEHCRGPYIAYASSNDIVLPGFYMRAIQALNDCPDSAGYYAVANHVVDGLPGLRSGGYGWARERSYLSPMAVVAALRDKGGSMGTVSAILRLDLAVEYLPFRDELAWFSDTYLMYCMALRYGIVYDPEPGAIIRVTAGSYFSKSSERRRGALVMAKLILALHSVRDLVEHVRQSQLFAYFGPQVIWAYVYWSPLRNLRLVGFTAGVWPRIILAYWKREFLALAYRLLPARLWESGKRILKPRDPVLGGRLISG